MHARLREGVDHFNSERFFEAHESWEELWLPERGSDREFLQGLIQLAAAYHHIRRGTTRGAGRLFDAALRRLSPYPPLHMEIDRASAVSSAERHRERLARGEKIDATEYPKLRLV